jgi:glutamate formiminotransferase
LVEDELFESVPNFSEGTRADVIEAIASAASTAYVLDADADPDHNRAVVSLAGFRRRLVEGLVAAVASAVEHIDLREHRGVHPRVGAADVVPIVPLGGTTLDLCRDVAHEVGERIWSQLAVPVYFYGHGEKHRLADIRAGRASLDLGSTPHPTAGAVCVGARPLLVAFNVILYDTDLVSARALARAIRETSAGLRGVQALAFELPGSRVQLSMNLFRTDETSPADVVAELGRRGVSMGAEQVVGLCPAVAASAAAGGRLLEGRLAASAAADGARRCRERGGEELEALAARLEGEAVGLAALAADQDAILAGAERAAALVGVLEAAHALHPEMEAMLGAAARGLRAAVSGATAAIYRARVDALDGRIAGLV